MSTWTIKDSIDLYGIEYWSGGFFTVNERGNINVTPYGEKGPKLDLLDLTNDLYARGIRPPILIRLPDILKARIELLGQCFAKAIAECDYKGQYRGVYPIKVNQQKHLVDELVEYGRPNRLGLECGSKPELLVALAKMNTPDALIICNGFKDTEYIETAVLSQKMGRNTFIVVDRLVELSLILNAAKKFNIKPRIGFRAKLGSQGAGRWVESGGHRSKFGLTAAEIVEGINQLKEVGMLEALELLHFHIGSQIPSIQSIKSVVREGATFFTQLYALGATPRFVDVGGGLGVDYDGSGSSDSSINYTEQEYANDVVSGFQTICDERQVPHPHIITEAGRALVAHNSVLVFNILGINEVGQSRLKSPATRKDHQIVKDLQYIFDNLKPENLRESFNDLMQAKGDIVQAFSFGVLNLEQRGKAESLFACIAPRMLEMCKKVEDVEDIAETLSQELSDTYFCNFSVFQSVPDSWAVGQLFPVMPIHRLNEEPTKKAILVDITCDSDGKIEKFIDIANGTPKKTLEVHELKESEPYYLSVFLTGAYQEILGDLHNLFGDTDTVHVTITEQGYKIEHVVEGDTVSEVLSYMQYHRGELVEKIRQATEESIVTGTISPQEAKLFLKYYEAGLAGYTYLEDPEE